VLERIAPLEVQLSGLTSSLESSAARVTQCQGELAALDGAVVQLKREFQVRIGEAEALKLDLSKAEATLGAATSLLAKLSGERGRWQTQARAICASICLFWGIGRGEGPAHGAPAAVRRAAAFRRRPPCRAGL
jgi:dynein heavy chain 2